MKLLIEDWSQKNLTENAMDLMEEAVMCYKVGAYRSAYLMSYLAFKTMIRERVLNAPKPDCINEQCWDEQILRPLGNDNKWEEKLNEIVFAATENGQGERGVFRFTNYERIKNRYIYWKDIRNSCAHAKDEHITSSTVEQFWNYMQDDLSEFYVLGGEAYLLDKLCYDYKYFNTVGKEELEKTLQEISYVYKKDIQRCFGQFYEKNRDCIMLSIKHTEFWKVIVSICNENILDGFLDFLYVHKEMFLLWYKAFPQLYFLMINRHKEIIQEYLAPQLEGEDYIDSNTFWHLFVEILKVDVKLINIDQVTSDYKKLKMIAQIDLQKEEMEILHQQKVFQKFLFNAGSAFFANTSDAHYQYYSDYLSIKDDRDIEECFKYLEWDINVIDKLNTAIEGLKESCHKRQNADKVILGNRREDAYKKIINQYKNDIKNTVQNNNKSINDFKFISCILSE